MENFHGKTKAEGLDWWAKSKKGENVSEESNDLTAKEYGSRNESIKSEWAKLTWTIMQHMWQMRPAVMNYD